jgi:hypothetical protein
LRKTVRDVFWSDGPAMVRNDLQYAANQAAEIAIIFSWAF